MTIAESRKSAAIWHKVTALIVLGCGLTDQVVAQGRTAPVAVRDVSVRFQHLTVADGLSQTTIYAIHQDRHGFMWFATQDGLNRYDGHTVKVYRHVPFDTTAIGDNTLVSITEDRDGFLWIGSGRGLHRMDPTTESFTAFRHDPDDERSLGSDEVRHVLEDREGGLWISTGRGLDRFDRDTREFAHYFHLPSDPLSLSHNGVLWTFEDRAGSLWVSTANGLNRMRPDGRTFDRFLTTTPGHPSPSPIEYTVQRLLERSDEPGVFWAATVDGLVRLNPATGESERFKPNEELGLGRIADLVQDPIAANVLWLAAPGAGLARFDIRTGEYSLYGTDPTDPQSLSTTNTERVFLDRSGMLWVGVNGVGVDRFNPATVGMSHLRHQPGSRSSLPGSHVRGIYQDRDGGLWTGTTDVQGASRLSRFDPATRTFSHYEHRAGDPQSLGKERVRAVLVDRTGAVWVGLAGAGLDRMAADRPGRFRHFRHEPDDPTSLSHDVVRHLLEDRSGAVWVATNGGVDRLISVDDGTFFHYRHDPDDETTLTSNRTSVLFESLAGFIWVGADGGLNRLDPLTGRVQRFLHNPRDRSTLASDAILALHERTREPGIIWVGTFGGGLNRLQVARGIVEHFTVRDGLPNNTVYGILEDDRGRLWMSTNVGLARFDPENNTVRTYGLDVGLQSLEYNSTAAHKGIYGEMFFGGVNGLNAFFPDELTENAHPPEVAIVDVRLSNQGVRARSGGLGSAAIHSADPLRLGPDQTDITFDFVALHFQNPSQNRYAYRLDGFNSEWVDSGTRRSASYTNLSPGRYTFRVRAANSDGVWNEEGASLAIVVEPPWWRTWWALLAYVLMFGGILFAAHRVRSERLMSRERERSRQRELEAARTIEVAYNHLRATQEQLIQAEKMASLGHLTAGIAHEIKNPLNFVNNFNDLTNETLDDIQDELAKVADTLPGSFRTELESLLEAVRFNTNRVREHGRRADAVVKNMLRHSQSSKSERHPADLNALLREYSSLVQRTYESKYPDLAVGIDASYDEGLGRIDVVPQDMGRVFMNLLHNAFEAINERYRKNAGTFEPKVSVTTKRERDLVEIRISDNGTGVAPDIRDKIFNPFFTTREVGEGAGLGLSMSYEIVAAHGGALELDGADEGATFVIRLPI